MSRLKNAVKGVLRILTAPFRWRNRRRIRRRTGGDAVVHKSYPNDKFLPCVRQAIREGHTATLTVKGYSMRPFLEHCRDKVTLSPVETLAVGDAVLAEIRPGTFVLHRIIRLEGDRLTLMGDGNLRGTESCRCADVAGVVTLYHRNGRCLKASGRGLRVSVRVWRSLLPVRRYLLFVYRLFI